ncbi:MAG TPA: DNA-protecting protein DprA [Saprospiraceae bacterium]|nr:DNA-protecting protein DprA [Saprospiraceae bacterium]
MEKDLAYKIALNKIPKVGAVIAKNLIQYFGSPEAVFEARKKELQSLPRITESIANLIVSKKPIEEAEKEIEFIEQNKINCLYFEDEAYPSRLKHYPDSPLLLYYKGNTNLNHKRIVAVVGTRKPSERGKLNCERLVEELKNYNVMLISGLAYGIDVTAHKKCLDLGIDTVGVLGHGLHRIYPAQHKAIAEKMIEQGGLLSEYTSDKGPEAKHFPMRNRIIAGMCDALVVVETTRKGGSIISVEFAVQYNKDVFAFPGRLNDKNSQGCNHLIKIQKAALIESAKDIGYIMRWEQQQSPSDLQKKLFIDLNPTEKNIIDILNKSEEVSIDKLTYESKLSPSQIAALLLNLEFKGIVKPLPGHRYMLV